MSLSRKVATVERPETPVTLIQQLDIAVSEGDLLAYLIHKTVRCTASDPQTDEEIVRPFRPYLLSGRYPVSDESIKWFVACGGWLVAVVLAFCGYLERRAAQRADLLLKTVAYFDGGTQKRSIGISLVEGLLRKDARHREVLIPLLNNQFVYLLLHPEVKDSVHEERNLVRLFFLLQRTPQLRARHYHSWCEIADAIERRLNGEASGLSISSVTVKLWRRDLGINEPIGA